MDYGNGQLWYRFLDSVLSEPASLSFLSCCSIAAPPPVITSFTQEVGICRTSRVTSAFLDIDAFRLWLLGISPRLTGIVGQADTKILSIHLVLETIEALP
ncbi:Gdnf Family Receptor Alpha-4 [Manis pentadactyla]|nr:Gdnf Family Receptor Alpha-4 [Manis pentadactyla]